MCADITLQCAIHHFHVAVCYDFHSQIFALSIQLVFFLPVSLQIPFAVLCFLVFTSSYELCLICFVLVSSISRMRISKISGYVALCYFFRASERLCFHTLFHSFRSHVQFNFSFFYFATY